MITSLLPKGWKPPNKKFNPVIDISIDALEIQSCLNWLSKDHTQQYDIGLVFISGKKNIFQLFSIRGELIRINKKN